jgi:hypothetical protein
MPVAHSDIAVLAVVCLATWGAVPALAQSVDPLGVGRKMLAEDNPGELWIERGKMLFYQKRGPTGASLEQCDFGLGSGKLKVADLHGSTAGIQSRRHRQESDQSCQQRRFRCGGPGALHHLQVERHEDEHLAPPSERIRDV